MFRLNIKEPTMFVKSASSNSSARAVYADTWLGFMDRVTTSKGPAFSMAQILTFWLNLISQASTQ